MRNILTASVAFVVSTFAAGIAAVRLAGLALAAVVILLVRWLVFRRRAGAAANPPLMRLGRIGDAS